MHIDTHVWLFSTCPIHGTSLHVLVCIMTLLHMQEVGERALWYMRRTRLHASWHLCTRKICRWARSMECDECACAREMINDLSLSRPMHFHHLSIFHYTCSGFYSRQMQSRFHSSITPAWVSLMVEACFPWSTFLYTCSGFTLSECGLCIVYLWLLLFSFLPIFDFALWNKTWSLWDI